MQPTSNVVADTICRTAELGLTITNAAHDAAMTLIECEALAPINECPSCSQPGLLRDHTYRELVDLPIVGFPTKLRVRVPRYICGNHACGQKIFRAGLACADDRSKVTHRVVRWILQRLAVDRMSIQATANALGIGWQLTCDLALSMARELISDPDHLAGVRVIGVDEHKWAHNFRAAGGGFVTVIVDMTHQHTGKPARLLDVIPGRSADVLTRWLNQHPKAFREGLEVITMDGFQGYATAAEEAIPHATRVMDPFHVVRLAGDKLTLCRQRLQRETTGRRGRKGDPLFQNRRTLLTRIGLLSGSQQQRLDNLFNYDDDYAVLQETWLVYQEIIDCYEDANKTRAKKKMSRLIDRLRGLRNVGLAELAQLGRTLHKRRTDVLAFFDIGASNGPVEAINGRLEHLRGIALGFRNINHYILRCLIHSGGLQSKINAL